MKQKTTYILNGRHFDTLDEATQYANANGWSIKQSETLTYKGAKRVILHV